MGRVLVQVITTLMSQMRKRLGLTILMGAVLHPISRPMCKKHLARFSPARSLNQLLQTRLRKPPQDPTSPHDHTVIQERGRTSQISKGRSDCPYLELVSLSLSIVFLARSFSKKFFFLQFDLNMARSWGSTSQGTKCSEKVPYYSKTLERQSQIEWFRCKAFKT